MKNPEHLDLSDNIVFEDSSGKKLDGEIIELRLNGDVVVENDIRQYVLSPRVRGWIELEPPEFLPDRVEYVDESFSEDFEVLDDQYLEKP